MKKVLATVLIATAVAGCAKTGFPEPTAKVVRDSDFSYLLTHLKIVKQSPLPDELPDGSNSAYRILGVTQQGNCVGGCPPSTLYVAAFNYTDHLDGHIRLCKIEGIRFFSQVRVTTYQPEIKDDVFLVFDVRSNIEPRMYRLYQIRVAPDNCSIQFVKEFRRST